MVCRRTGGRHASRPPPRLRRLVYVLAVALTLVILPATVYVELTAPVAVGKVTGVVASSGWSLHELRLHGDVSGAAKVTGLDPTRAAEMYARAIASSFRGTGTPVVTGFVAEPPDNPPGRAPDLFPVNAGLQISGQRTGRQGAEAFTPGLQLPPGTADTATPPTTAQAPTTVVNTGFDSPRSLPHSRTPIWVTAVESGDS